MHTSTMSADVPALPLGLDPLIAEAKQRARRRRLLVLAAAGLIAAGLLAFELAPSRTGGGHTARSRGCRRNRASARRTRRFAAPCTATQLHGSMDATGSSNDRGPTQEFGTIELVNRSSTACALVGSPRFSAEGWPDDSLPVGPGRNPGYPQRPARAARRIFASAPSGRARPGPTAGPWLHSRPE